MTSSSPALALALGLTLLASPSAQTRPTGSRMAVPAEAVRLLDGDTAVIRWVPADLETVRVLGIDTAELFGSKKRHPEGHKAQITAAGAEARGFARGAFAGVRRIELLRSAQLDRYRRTLGYFFLDDRNYSVLVILAGLSGETISKYGDNGLPEEAAEVLEAARHAPPRKDAPATQGAGR